ncbi:hypothetical protein ACWCXB_21755 [Streptomyces sp. NPDC001514]
MYFSDRDGNGWAQEWTRRATQPLQKLLAEQTRKRRSGEDANGGDAD